jgi:hypothetical protein
MRFELTPDNLDYLDYYMEFTDSTAVYPDEVALTYSILGLVNELAETIECYNDQIAQNDTNLKAIALELGDVVYYLCRIVKHLGLPPLSTLFSQYSLSKLDSSRYAVMRLSKVFEKAVIYSGFFAGTLKKQLRGDEAYQSLDTLQSKMRVMSLFVILDELALLFGFNNLLSIMNLNMAKLSARKLAGTIKGDGDYR